MFMVITIFCMSTIITIRILYVVESATERKNRNRLSVVDGFAKRTEPCIFIWFWTPVLTGVTRLGNSYETFTVDKWCMAIRERVLFL